MDGSTIIIPEIKPRLCCCGDVWNFVLWLLLPVLRRFTVCIQSDPFQRSCFVSPTSGSNPAPELKSRWPMQCQSRSKLVSWNKFILHPLKEDVGGNWRGEVYRKEKDEVIVVYRFAFNSILNALCNEVVSREKSKMSWGERECKI